jgi:hypothetical protein
MKSVAYSTHSKSGEYRSETTEFARKEPNMAKREIPAPPRGSRARGRRLWTDILTRFELEQHELCLLAEIVRTADLLDELVAIAAAEGLMVSGPHGSKPHPAVVEARQARIALARLTAALRLPTGDEGEGGQEELVRRRPQQRRVGVRGVYSMVAGA